MMQYRYRNPLCSSVLSFPWFSTCESRCRPGAGGRSPQSLIDYNICRLVVPSSLLGTYLGVILNRVLPSWLILLALTGILIFITWGVGRTARQQFLEENG